MSLDSIQPGGDGFASSIRVRLLHAAVRQRIMRLAKQRPSYYDVERFGIPINDLDCVATISTFSATLIWLSFPRQGIFLRRQEIFDYIALWRYIAHLTGTPTDFFETPEKAKIVMESLLMNEISPTEVSKVLAGNIINSLMGQPPIYASKEFLEANSRWLNGNKLCDSLGLGRPSMWYWALSVGQCIFFMITCYTSRSFRYLDKRKMKTSRRFLWTMIVDGKHGLGGTTSFNFKYVPDLHKTTYAESAEKAGLSQPGIERRNLRVLVASCAFLMLSGMLCIKLMGILARKLF
jgi:hypothetical protein